MRIGVSLLNNQGIEDAQALVGIQWSLALSATAVVVIAAVLFARATRRFRR